MQFLSSSQGKGKQWKASGRSVYCRPRVLSCRSTWNHRLKNPLTAQDAVAIQFQTSADSRASLSLQRGRDLARSGETWRDLASLLTADRIRVGFNHDYPSSIEQQQVRPHSAPIMAWSGFFFGLRDLTEKRNQRSVQLNRRNTYDSENQIIYAPFTRWFL